MHSALRAFPDLLGKHDALDKLHLSLALLAEFSFLLTFKDPLDPFAEELSNGFADRLDRHHLIDEGGRHSLVVIDPAPM